MEKETRELSLLSIGLPVRIRLTTRHSSSALEIHWSIRATSEQPNSFLTIQSYRQRAELLKFRRAVNIHSPLIVNLNNHRLRFVQTAREYVYSILIYNYYNILIIQYINCQSYMLQYM